MSLSLDARPQWNWIIYRLKSPSPHFSPGPGVVSVRRAQGPQPRRGCGPVGSSRIPFQSGSASTAGGGLDGEKSNCEYQTANPCRQGDPRPPVGPALGQHGVNIMHFCKAFNAKTSGKDQEGLIIPVVITVFADRSFAFITKTPPAAVLLKRLAGIAKGPALPTGTRWVR